MAKADFNGRVGKAREGLAVKRLDALLVSDMKNIRYLCGFTGSSAYMLITAGKRFFLTDSRYASQARDEVRGCRVRIYKKAFEAVTGLVAAEKIRALGFESESLPYDAFLRLKKQLPGIRLRPAPGTAGKARVRKDPFEIEKIRACARVLDNGFVEAARVIRAGVAEKEAASLIELSFRKAGADALAFDTILASGPRGALPHGKASSKRIRRGELVVLDMGVCLDGYNSDGTRTFCAGRPSAEQRKVYRTVLDAQLSAIGKVAPGVKAVEVDSAARSLIEKAGYGRFFGHGLGHGVGLDVHERPSLSPMSKDTLEEGMVVTIEPGIYIPGWGGVRIEDMVLVTKDGFEVLTTTSKELVSLQSGG